MLIPIDATNSDHHRSIASIWSTACGNCFTISPSFVAYNLDAAPGLEQEGRLSVGELGTPAGFVVVSRLTGDPGTSPPTHGWIDAIAVLPECQEQGHGASLLQWAEEWLVERGGTDVTLGCGLRTFTPGVPPDTLSAPFFMGRGYRVRETAAEGLVWDVAADLSAYATPATVREIPGQVRPAAPGDHEALTNFLDREFPGRWRFEAVDYLARGGRIGDFMLLWTDDGVDGFCQLTFEDSPRPLERYYPYGLPRPWGQLGAIGVSASVRGRGYGAAVLDAGLRRLRDNGVRGCVIDWTDLLGFYGKFGFSQYREYLQLNKKLQR
ncbi:MAG: GNAT family N-acetyltransferase [Caldilineaceae bacterium]